MTKHYKKKEIQQLQRRKGYIIQSLTGGIDQWFSTRDIHAPRNICQYLEAFLMSPLGGGEEKD